MHQLYAQKSSIGEVSNSGTVTGLAVGIAAVEAYALYKVLSSSGKKDWAWYLLGAAVGINILMKMVVAAKV